jgi:putative heme-binding domain-containing protein
LFHDWIAAMPVRQTNVHEWTMEELEPGLGELAGEGSRETEAGAAAFREAGCIQCHRFHGEGGSVGPDLTGIGRRLAPRDLLESILLPSKTIAPEYATTEIELLTDELYVGRVEGEDAQTIRLRPVGSLEEPLTLLKTSVWTRRLSSVSNMPGGLINTLNRRQVLDLLTYLIADEPGTSPP